MSPSEESTFCLVKSAALERWMWKNEVGAVLLDSYYGASLIIGSLLLFICKSAMV